MKKRNRFISVLAIAAFVFGSLFMSCGDTDDGEYTYTPPANTSAAEKKGGKTTLTVRDNGRGFSKEERSRAFDRFFSGDKSHNKGSGIGLSIAKSIAKVLHAKITIENDGGAVVRIVI